jgi:hypothetical protein
MEEDSRHWKGKQGTNKTVRQARPYRDQREDAKEQKLFDAQNDVFKSYKKNQGWKASFLHSRLGILTGAA